jgi:hypothetical protein
MQASNKNNLQDFRADNAAGLQELLEKPQIKSQEWQITAAKMTSIEHSKTLSADTADDQYLKSIALCKWAQTAGVVEAKKKNIQATRFRTKSPPSLGSLDRKELINAALDLLISLRGDWCSSYITGNLYELSIDKKGFNLLLKWADKISQNPSELLQTLLPNVDYVNTNEERTLALIKNAGAKIYFPPELATSEAALQILKIITQICELLRTNLKPKVGAALVQLILTCINKIKFSHPSAIINGHFVTAINYMQNQLEKTAYKKKIIAISSEQIAPTLALLTDFCIIGGNDASHYTEALIPTLKNTYQNLEKQLNDASEKNSLIQIINNKTTDDNNLNFEDSAIAVFARLIPNWLDYYAENNSSDELRLINENLLSAANINRIELLGSPGDELSYDPVEHKLDRDLSNATTVKIIRPGIIFRRTNNTYRIILPAIVSAM